MGHWEGKYKCDPLIRINSSLIGTEPKKRSIITGKNPIIKNGIYNMNRERVFRFNFLDEYELKI